VAPRASVADGVTAAKRPRLPYAAGPSRSAIREIGSRPRRQRARFGDSRRESASDCWGRTARAKRPPSRSSRACWRRRRATWRCWPAVGPSRRRLAPAPGHLTAGDPLPGQAVGPRGADAVSQLLPAGPRTIGRNRVARLDGEGVRLGRQAVRGPEAAAGRRVRSRGRSRTALSRRADHGPRPSIRRQLWEVIRAFGRRGRTIVLTTHYMDEAERLCDRVAIVDRGTVIALGSPAELIASMGGAHVVEFACGPGAPLEQADLTSLPRCKAR